MADFVCFAVKSIASSQTDSLLYLSASSHRPGYRGRSIQILCAENADLPRSLSSYALRVSQNTYN